MLKKFLSFKAKNLHERCLTLFYALGFLILLSMRSQVYEKALMTTSKGWSFPDSFNADSGALEVFYFSTLALQLISAVLPRITLFRALTAYLWWLLIYSMYSFGDFSHDYFGWLAAHFILVLPTSLLDNHQVFLCLRAFALSIYFNAGTWKLRGLFLNHVDHWWQDVAYTLPSHIARTFNEGVAANIQVMTFLQNHYYLSGIIWLTLIATQLSTVVMLFLPKYDFFWGWLIIFFHLGTAFILGVEFRGHLQLIFFIFFLIPAILAQEIDSKAH
jgi:hypothetical protein